MRLILLTRAMESSSEVLPALGLLAHHVRTMPAEPTALLNAPTCDALLVDGRRDLPAVRDVLRRGGGNPGGRGEILRGHVETALEDERHGCVDERCPAGLGSQRRCSGRLRQGLHHSGTISE